MKNANSICWHFSSIKSSKILLCVSLEANQGPAPRLHYCFLAAPPLSLHPLPSLISNCLNLPFGTQGRSWRLECVPYKQGMGDAERLPCPGSPQGPAQIQYVITESMEAVLCYVFSCSSFHSEGRDTLAFPIVDSITEIYKISNKREMQCQVVLEYRIMLNK